MPIPQRLIDVYKKQRYHFVGKGAVIKRCHWLYRSLVTRGEETCYKRWYGIRSHRCVQMSPTLACSARCLFCWRANPLDLNLDWSELHVDVVDEPALIVENSIREQRRILSGYKGNPNVDGRMLEEAMDPIHAAISLVGEPTLYPHLDELIYEYFSHGFRTVFLVTNGMFPDVLSDLSHEPSQLYVSVCAPDRDTYRVACRPLLPDGWRRLNETLGLLHSFRCPTVIRITLVRGLNLKDAEGYAKLVSKANPLYVEPKAAMAVGFFERRLPRGAMPTHTEVRGFAERLAELTGYNVVDESPPSRVVLLSRLKRPMELV
ncbi:TPA: 4-demethylwyosine synthase TYW1 [Candidatus Bathyarchaeota archaeon]|nr:4-demethylwyosine synthase TYW1 [Candidatus Bathyarchaeota archaeon]